MKPQVVIVGAGFAGLSATKGLKNFDAEITLVDRSNHHLFQPLLYQIATAALAPLDIATPIRAILRHQKNTDVVMDEVTGIDTVQKKVLFSDRDPIGFDYLVLATGAQQSYFAHPEWKKFAPALKSILDATKIRRDILIAFEKAEIEKDPVQQKALLTFVLVGGGPTGVELAGAIAGLAHQTLRDDFRHIDPKLTRVVLIEAGKRILASFSEENSEKAKKELCHLGVEVMCNSRVEAIDAEGVTYSGTRIAVRNVIWTAGVAASPAGKWLGANVDQAGRVLVEADLSVPRHPNIFVLGDTASLIQAGKPLPGLAPVALQQGKFIAELIRERIKGSQVPRKFHYFDKGNLATVGRGYAIADFGRFHLHGLVAWFLWVVVHIYYLIGFRNRMFVIMEWFWAYVTFRPGARLISEPHLAIPQLAVDTDNDDGKLKAVTR